MKAKKKAKQSIISKFDNVFRFILVLSVVNSFIFYFKALKVKKAATALKNKSYLKMRVKSIKMVGLRLPVFKGVPIDTKMAKLYPISRHSLSKGQNVS